MRSEKNVNLHLPSWKKLRLTLALTTAFLASAAAAQAPSPSEFIVRPSDKNSCGTGNVPLEFHEGLPLAKVSVNQHIMTFLIDSAGMTMINSDRVILPMVQQIHTGIITASSAEPLQLWNVVRIQSLKIGSAEIRDSNVLSRSLRSLESQLGRELDGIIGMDVLRLWDSVSLNYKAKVLALDGATCIHTKSSESLARLQYDAGPLIGKAWR
jgi:hypothetical protein